MFTCNLCNFVYKVLGTKGKPTFDSDTWQNNGNNVAKHVFFVGL